MKAEGCKTAFLCSCGTHCGCEGHAQTLKYIDTPHRFELVPAPDLVLPHSATRWKAGLCFSLNSVEVLGDLELIGKRQAAQKLGTKTKEKAL